MVCHIVFLVAALLLTLGAVGHTFGGMFGIAKQGSGSGAEADRVFGEMKAVRFQWRGADTSWFAFWMGNGLGVSALLILAVAVLCVLGIAPPAYAPPLVPLAWAVTVTLALLAVIGFRYFAPRVGIVFGIVAALSGAGAVLMTLSLAGA